MSHDDIKLREVRESDLPVLFEHQCDLVACAMVGFKSRPRDAFNAHWERILANPRVISRTIEAGGRVVGNVVCFDQGGKRQIGYWLGREFWGRGIATAAVAQFLQQIDERPLHAFVAKHNAGSIRVLEKCGFVRLVGEQPAHSNDPDNEFCFVLE